MQRRFDTFSFQPARKTREGYLICKARCAKAGVLVYKNGDGTERRELVLPEELERDDSLGSIPRKPVCDDHPPTAVDASNAREYSRGLVLDTVAYEDGYVEAEFLIQDQTLIDKIERGEKREVSLGYDLEEIDFSPGEHPEFGAYDAIQRGRICNHAAVVKRGRAGPSVAVRVDGQDTDQQPTDEDTFFYREDDSMTTEKNQDEFTEKLDAATAAIAEINERVDALQADADEDEGEEESGPLKEIADAMSGFSEILDGIKSEAQAKQDKYDEMKGQFDALMSEFQEQKGDMEGEEHDDKRGDSADEDDQKARLDWYNERRDLERHAEHYKLDAEEIKDLDNPALRRKIVEEHTGTERTDAPDAEIKGAFGLIKDLRAKRDGSYEEASEAAKEGREDAKTGDEANAQQRYQDKQMNAWKGEE